MYLDEGRERKGTEKEKMQGRVKEVKKDRQSDTWERTVLCWVLDDKEEQFQLLHYYSQQGRRDEEFIFS